MTRCLGLDIGSSSIKGAVLDLESGEAINCLACPFPAPKPGLPANWIEIEPAAALAQAELVRAELLDAAPEATNLFCCGHR